MGIVRHNLPEQLLLCRIVFGCAVFGLVNTSQVRAQAQTESTSISGPEYEVATIKLDRAGDITQRVRFVYTPGGLSAKNITLQLLIRDAYGVADFQITGGPNWLNSMEYDVEAKMEESAADEL